MPKSKAPTKADRDKADAGLDRTIDDVLDKLRTELHAELAEAIGDVNLAWNKLHESLAILFVAITKMPSEAMARGVWYSQKSDAAQRRMLHAALSASGDRRENLIKAAISAVNKTGNLANKRNETIHTHFELAIDKGGLCYVPNHWSGSELAEKLAGKDVVKEFRNHAERAGRLTAYTKEIRERFEHPHDNSPLPRMS